MKKNDIILIISILIISCCIVIGVNIYQRNNTDDTAMVLVTIDGEKYGTYPLGTGYTEEIRFSDGSYNILKIENGYVEVAKADCRDQICVNHFHIHYTGENIVCLPHKLVIEIVGGEENDVDVTTN